MQTQQKFQTFFSGVKSDSRNKINKFAANRWYDHQMGDPRTGLMVHSFNIYSFAPDIRCNISMINLLRRSQKHAENNATNIKRRDKNISNLVWKRAFDRSVTKRLITWSNNNYIYHTA